MKRLIAAFLIASPAFSWYLTGHQVVAGLAYDQLTAKTRARVDELIRKHPDYSEFSRDAPIEPAARARYAFMRAATWPDRIKNDARFYNEARRDSLPTPTLPGYPDMKAHESWHYIDVPFSTDGTPLGPVPEPNALTEIKRMIEALPKGAPVGTPDDPIYMLPWILHLAGDLHEPLHCVERYRKGQVRNGKPIGDAGGNFVYVIGSAALVTNLHSVWDAAPAEVDAEDLIEPTLAIVAKIPKEKKAVVDPQVWVNEGIAIAKKDVYSFGNEGGLTRENPVVLTPAYFARAKEISRQRVALAGQRLAAILNSKLN